MESSGKSNDAKRLFENKTLLLTYQEIAERLRIPVSTLQKWVMAGDSIPFYKLGRSVRFEAEEVAKWLASRKRGKNVP
jgi:excisionase family DNA binding protein